jgi:hypothetical protein
MMLTVLFLRSPTNLRAYGADDDKAHPAISVLYSVPVTLTNHYWVTSDERRRTDRSFALEVDVEGVKTSAETRWLLTAPKAAWAMATRKRTAARAA